MENVEMNINKIEDLQVKDICSKDIKSARYNETIQSAANIMSKYKIGAVLVVNKENLPIGIITNDDIIRKVVQFNKKASSIKCSEIMSQPLITIDGENNLIEAMRKMVNNNVKRLIVMYENKLYGIISSTDVLKHSPDYIEVLKQQMEIVEESIEHQVDNYTGYCQICGAWSDDLKQSEDGLFVCDDCL
ncbi:MAG: CBS domain-containing protein [Candidatus Helarchaeota archaeon]